VDRQTSFIPCPCPQRAQEVSTWETLILHSSWSVNPGTFCWKKVFHLSPNDFSVTQDYQALIPHICLCFTSNKWVCVVPACATPSMPSPPSNNRCVLPVVPLVTQTWHLLTPSLTRVLQSVSTLPFFPWTYFQILLFLSTPCGREQSGVYILFSRPRQQPLGDILVIFPSSIHIGRL
jgi:hypothetical protein